MRSHAKDKITRVKHKLVSSCSIRQIAIECFVSRSTVAQIAQQCNLDCHISKPGRPSKLTESTKRKIVRSILAGKVATATAAAKSLQSTSIIHVSAATVRMALKQY